MSTLMIVSWCPGTTCDPCKKPPPPSPGGTVYTNSGGWYAIVFQFTDITGTSWVAIERNVLYDASPNYSGNQIGDFAAATDAIAAAIDTLNRSHPIISEPLVAPVGPGTGHPPGTTTSPTTWIGANGSTVTQ